MIAYDHFNLPHGFLWVSMGTRTQYITPGAVLMRMEQLMMEVMIVLLMPDVTNDEQLMTIL